MDNREKYYRVDKLRIYYDENGVEEFDGIHRQRTFDTLEEAKEYMGEGSSVWRMKLYEVEEKLLDSKEPKPQEVLTPEEEKALEEKIAKMVAEWKREDDLEAAEQDQTEPEPDGKLPNCT